MDMNRAAISILHCFKRKMFRRQGNKKVMLGLVALCIFVVILFEGQHLTRDTLQRSYTHLFSHGVPSTTPSPANISGAKRQVASVAETKLGQPTAVGHSSEEKLAGVLTTRPPPRTTTPYWMNREYARRRLLSQNVCSRLRTGSVVRLTRFGNTSYCVVPKVGCTFWLNVFRFLHGDTGSSNVSSPFDIPRMFTHYGRMKHMRYFTTNASFAPKHLVDDLRFMFVRDPYSRLWSAYVDKFLLVDYWRTEGKNIVKLRPKKDNLTMCARDISFKEFLEFVSTRSSPKALNEHWRPIQYQCSPCLYQPHVIGKIETFSKDSRYVLQLMNASWILDSYDHQLHVYQEMDMLITYNFQVIKNSHYTNCTNATDLSRRLWKTFQINGYIPIEMDFPDPGPAGINASRFRTLAREAYKNRPQKSSAEWRKQRQQMMVDAFQDVSTETLEKLKKVYKEDFELFDYDPEPDFVFANRSKSAKKYTS